MVRNGDNQTKMPSAVISVGAFSYLNVQPIYYGLLRQPQNNAIHIVKGTPAYLNAALLDGTVGLSCMSSWAFAKYCHVLHLLPHLSISALGAVESVLLFSRYADWKALDGKKVAVTDHSATAVNLLQILFKHRYGVTPSFVPMQSNLETMFATCDAALLIGDIALIEGKLRREMAWGVPNVFDLGHEWAEWTGLPFVFGVWAVHRDKTNALVQSGLLEQLYASKREGLMHIDDIGKEQALQSGLSSEICTHYLRQMTYDLSDVDQQGWRYFLELSLPGFRWGNINWL